MTWYALCTATRRIGSVPSFSRGASRLACSAWASPFLSRPVSSAAERTEIRVIGLEPSQVMITPRETKSCARQDRPAWRGVSFFLLARSTRGRTSANSHTGHRKHLDKHRGNLRCTTPGACPQPEPNATELPNCASISSRAEQRRRGSGGVGVARRARAARAPKAKSCTTPYGTPYATS